MSIRRRDFMLGAAALGAGSLAGSRLGWALPADSSGAARGPAVPLDIAEWSYFWVGVERAELARGAVVNGKQMYVEYQVPSRVRHPYPVVLVHGGGGQGTDWMGTPDGRPGWATYLLQEGYRVYVVDRPGHGRSPFHPDLHGPFPAQAPTLEFFSGRFTPPTASTPNPAPLRRLHTQWPGTGEVGSTDLDQFVASQGGAYVTGGAGRPGGAPALDVAHAAWRERGAMLLDRIGPSIFMTHSAGGPFGWLVAEARPDLVKAIVVIEGAGAPFAGANVWGLSTIPVTYDPPVSDPSEIKTVTVTPSEPGLNPYLVQAEPARKLPKLRGIPTVVVTAEASFASPGNPGAVAFLQQAGCKAEELRLLDHGIHGNGHMMMVEKNNREVLQPILDWIDRNVPAGTSAGTAARVPAGRAGRESTALTLAEQGFFWVGVEHRTTPYGTILHGQMYVQYLTPARVRHPYPVVLVHGGTGQMLHYLGPGDGALGWAHYYVQEGYRVFLVDRPGHGRAPYHPDALGAIGPQPTYAGIAADVRRAASGPHRQWPGTGEVGDPLLDQLMASQNAAPQDQDMARALWASRGAALLDRIGPAILQTHSAGGPFGWLAAAQRPQQVKAIVCVEGATSLPADQAGSLANLKGIPIVVVTAEKSGRNQGPAVDALRQAGCSAEELRLADRGLLGNGHFMMLENNRREVFDVIRGWIEEKVVEPHA